MRAVVIEDNPDIIGLLAFLLQDAGYEVTQVSDNYEQLFNVEAWDGVDVAIIDLNLPGFGLMELPGFGGGRIAAFLHASVPHVKRVILTAHGLDYVPDEVFWVAQAVLEKPVDREDLLAAMPPMRLPEAVDSISEGLEPS